MFSFKKPISILIFLCCFSCFAKTSDENWYMCDPVVVRLNGVIIERKLYGMPNFGETPKIDQKLKIQFLKLTRPINVKGDPKNDECNRNFTKVTQIQLNADFPLKKYILKNVVLEGTLYERTAGTEYTDVLMDVKKVYKSN